MGLKDIYKKKENKLIALGFIFVLFIFAAVRYDFYFDLNDDVVMKDILSGAYTGAPESRNIQMLYPVSLLISLLYRIFRQLPVYGIFLCLCQFGCFYLIAERSLRFCSSTLTKIWMAALQGVIITALFLEHFLFVQYTVTSALLAGTAVFLFVTMENEPKANAFLKKNILNIALIILAFCIRTEMLALVLPLICVAGIYKWEKEQPIFTKENFRKYLTVFGSILAGMAVAYAVNGIAYGGSGWKEFMRFFDSRTQLYDFQGIPAYEGNEAFYDRMGMTESEQKMLFEQYNFGLDDTVDAVTLDAMSVYQAIRREAEGTFTDRLIKKFGEYRYRTFHKTTDDFPWNMLVLLGYLCVFIAGIWNAMDNSKYEKRTLNSVWKTGWKLALLGMVRTALWMFLLLRERVPIRITHSLYLVELCFLFGMLQIECAGITARIYGKLKATVVFPAVIAVSMVTSLFSCIAAADQAYAGREAANRTYLAVQDYCRSRSGNFYFIDVYSFVSDPHSLVPYSEKMFEDVNHGIANYDIMGGWLTKSPLYEKKLKAFGLESMQQAIAENENVYFMANLDKGTDSLEDYYLAQDMIIQTELVDTINEVIGVYSISGKERSPADG